MKEIESPENSRSFRLRNAYGYYGIAPSDSGSFDWREYYFAVKERLWLVIFFVVIFSCIGFYEGSSQVFRYRATSVLVIEQVKSRVLDPKLESVTDNQIKSMDMINTLVEYMGTYPFALRVVNSLQLAQDSNFLRTTGIFGKNPSPEQIARVVEGMVSTSYRQGTDLIDISVISRNGAVSVKIANGYAEEYLRYEEDQKMVATRQASAFLMDEAERLRKKMRASEEGMQNFREREKATSIETMLQEVQSQIAECSSRQYNLNTQLDQIKTDLESAQADNGDPQALLALPSVAAESQVAALVAKIGDLEKQFALVKLRYRAKHPVYVTIKTQIDLSNADLNKLLKNVVPLLKSMRDNLTAQEAATEIERENAEKRLLEVSSKSIEYNDLNRELESDSALYDSILSRIKEVDVTKGLSDSSVLIHELAQGAVTVGQNPYFIVFKKIMTGLAVGLGVVIGLHKLDGSFKTVEQIEQFTKLNVLAAIPQIGTASSSALGFLSLEQVRELLVVLKRCAGVIFKTTFPVHDRISRCLDLLQPTLLWIANPIRGISALPENQLVVRDDRNGIVAESFRSLRSTVAMNPRVENLRTFLFTSAVPAEGKSFCSSNFAISLAQQGFRTLLIDSDLRKPMISRIFFGTNRNPGVVEVLQGTATLDMAAHSTSTEGLFILTAGGRSSNPSELLAGQGFRDIVSEALKRYDRIVIDSAPLLAVSDTLLIAFQAEILCLVVRSFVTPRRLIRRAIKSLDEMQIQPAGIVFNCLPYGKGSYYYYTSGKYYGDYGKKSY